MLSLHEFSTLILIKDSSQQIDPGCAEIAALVKRQLVSIDAAEGAARVTARGECILEALSLLSRAQQSS